MNNITYFFFKTNIRVELQKGKKVLMIFVEELPF